MSTGEMVRRVKRLPVFLQGMAVGGVVLLLVTAVLIFRQGVTPTRAIAQGLGASFTWNGAGNAVTTAHVVNDSYTGPRPTQAVYAIYWCKKGGTADCAPDFSGDRRADETLTFQTVTLPVPDVGQTEHIQMPAVSELAAKSCGRFQVDLGLMNNGGIVGGKTFAIGGDCPETPMGSPQATPRVTPASSPHTSASPAASGIGGAPSCPYQSTQAQVQKDVNDPWGDSKTITLGQSVRFGGFHNGTGRFAGDSSNTYSPNTANVDFVINEPGGTASTTLTPGYPISFTPTKTGTYAFTGKTRRDVTNANAGYFSESGCTDSGTVTVLALASSPAPSVSPSPSSTPSPSASVTPGKVELRICKYNDTNGDGVVNDGEKTKKWSFTVHPQTESPRTIETHWWNIFSQDCVVTDVPTEVEIRVTEAAQPGWRRTAIYADGTKMSDPSTSYYSFISKPNTVKTLWFLNTFTPVGGAASSPAASPSSSPGTSPSPSSSPQVLGVGTQTPTALPKAGAETLFSLGYAVSAVAGVSLKLLARKLRNI